MRGMNRPAKIPKTLIERRKPRGLIAFVGIDDATPAVVEVRSELDLIGRLLAVAEICQSNAKRAIAAVDDLGDIIGGDARAMRKVIELMAADDLPAAADLLIDRIQRLERLNCVGPIITKSQ